MKCELCANYHNCNEVDQTDCFEKIRTVYDVIPNGLAFKSSDFYEEDRIRMNFFFKSEYGFWFKDVNSDVFDIQLNDVLMRTSKTRDIVLGLARKVIRTRTSPAQHKYVNWDVFEFIDIECDAEITEEQVKAMFFKLPELDAQVSQIDCEVDMDGEATLYVYINNDDPNDYLQETIEWGQKLTETGNEHSFSDEYYDGFDVVIIYWGKFE